MFEHLTKLGSHEFVCSGFQCRYTYFPCSRRQFGLLGPSLLEIDHDERPEDGTLASSLGVNSVSPLVQHNAMN